MSPRSLTSPNGTGGTMGTGLSPKSHIPIYETKPILGPDEARKRNPSGLWIDASKPGPAFLTEADRHEPFSRSNFHESPKVYH